MKLDFYDYMDLICDSDVHTLIAGCTGSGKSVLLNGVILNILTIDGAGLYLIDPKGVELIQYRDSVHTVAYAYTDEEIISVIHSATEEMDRRFKDMRRKGLRRTDLPPRFVIIDELAQFSKKVNPKLAKANEDLSRIATLGRASGIFLIGCTQRPTNDVITPLLKINCDCKIALRTDSEQESRNIIKVSDAHYLPRHGFCYIAHPNFMGIRKEPVEYYSDNTIYDFVKSCGIRKRGILRRLLGV